MRSFYPPSLLHSFFVGLSLVGLSACASLGSAEEAGDTRGGAGGGFGAGAGGDDFASSGAGIGSGGTIDISPPSSSVGGSPAPYAALCGAGECSLGDDAEGCAAAEDGAGGSASATPPELSCAVVNTEGDASSKCLPSGTSLVHEPCNSVSDCGPGLGCALVGGRGQCEPYCCGSVEACPSQTLCAPLPIAEAPDAQIPVCVPTRACQLLDPKSCCNGDDCSSACTVVRDDGTTSCVIPGDGELDDPCPCAAGFICSKLTNECKQLCHTGVDTAECAGGGKCQGGSGGLPTGIGICVAAMGSNYAE